MGEAVTGVGGVDTLEGMGSTGFPLPTGARAAGFTEPVFFMACEREGNCVSRAGKLESLVGPSVLERPGL